MGFFEFFDMRKFDNASKRWRTAFEKYLHVVPKDEAQKVFCYWVFGVVNKRGELKYKRKPWLVGDKKLISRSMRELSESLPD